MAGGFRLQEKGIYRVVNAVLLAGIALFGAGGFLGLYSSGSMADPGGAGNLVVFLALEAVVILGLCAGIEFLPVRGKFVCLSAAVVGLWGAAAVMGGPESLLLLRSYLPWLMGKGGYAEWASGYAALHMIIIAISCYFLQILFEKLPRLKTVSAALLLAGGCACLFSGREPARPGMAFGLCYIAAVCAEWVWERRDKVKSGDRRAYMLRIMPFLAVYLVLMACMPAPEKPYDWLWVKNIYGRLEEAVRVYARKLRWGGREGFGMAFTGFSEDGTLGEGILEESEETLRVRISGGSVANLYLTGMVYDTFDGRQWLQTWEGDEAEVFWDAAETLCAAEAFAEGYRSDYLKSAELTVEYRDFNTKYVFAPLKTWEIWSGERDFQCKSQGGSLRLERYQGYGATYRLRYYQLNAGQAEFDRFLEAFSGSGVSSGKGLYADAALLAEMGQKYGEDDTREGAARRRQDIYENYLGGVCLSDKVSGYLERITAGSKTTVEKLRAIERELASMSYNAAPGGLPEEIRDGSDFLDYFLLERREGYCTYFATAFALLARAEGIPARYVQGYCVPIEGAKEVSVYSDMAHAWPEVYFPGAGWIPFEPTPGYGGIRYDPWKLMRPQEEQGGEERESAEIMPETDGEEEDFRAPEDDGSNEQGREEADIAARERRTRFLRLLGFALPAVLAGYVLVLAAEGAWSRHRYRKMSREEQFRLEVLRNMELLALLGLKKGERETLQELRERSRQDILRLREAQSQEKPGQEERSREKPGHEREGQEDPGQEKQSLEEPGQERKGQEDPGQEKQSRERPKQEKQSQEDLGQEKRSLENSGQERENRQDPGQERKSQEDPGQEKRSLENPGQERENRQDPGQERKSQEDPGQEKRSLENPGQERENRQDPGQERKSQEDPGQEKQGQERPEQEKQSQRGAERESQRLEMPDPLQFIKEYEDVIYGGRIVEEGMVLGAVRERQMLLELLWHENRLACIFWRFRAYLGGYG